MCVPFAKNIDQEISRQKLFKKKEQVVKLIDLKLTLVAIIINELHLYSKQNYKL